MRSSDSSRLARRIFRMRMISSSSVHADQKPLQLEIDVSPIQEARTDFSSVGSPSLRDRWAELPDLVKRKVDFVGRWLRRCLSSYNHVTSSTTAIACPSGPQRCAMVTRAFMDLFGRRRPHYDVRAFVFRTTSRLAPPRLSVGVPERPSATSAMTAHRRCVPPCNGRLALPCGGQNNIWQISVRRRS